MVTPKRNELFGDDEDMVELYNLPEGYFDEKTVKRIQVIVN